MQEVGYVIVVAVFALIVYFIARAALSGNSGERQEWYSGAMALFALTSVIGVIATSCAGR